MSQQQERLKKEKMELLDYWRRSHIIWNEKVLRAFETVQRENFVLELCINDAYRDCPLPILAGQTISQPTTVMLMTQALELKETDKVLEVGTGSGYQAAIIAEIVRKGKIYSTEIISILADFAKQNLIRAGITNVEVICWDGSNGYEEESPYDKIIVTAACPNIPRPLIEQLREGGIMLAPVGSSGYGQEMLKIHKTGVTYTVENLGDFVFVPLRGKYGHY